MANKDTKTTEEAFNDLSNAFTELSENMGLSAMAAAKAFSKLTTSINLDSLHCLQGRHKLILKTDNADNEYLTCYCEKAKSYNPAKIKQYKVDQVTNKLTDKDESGWRYVDR